MTILQHEYELQKMTNRLIRYRYGYAKLYVDLDVPETPYENDLYYNTTTKELYRYSQNVWYKIDWQSIVKSSPEWVANRLRISNNQLQISPDGTNWFDCIPAIGANVIELASIDNTNYSLKYFVMPNQTIILRNANHIPIAYAKDVEPYFVGLYRNEYAYGGFIGLRPSNTAISNGDGQYAYGYGSSRSANRTTGMSIVPVTLHVNNLHNRFRFELFIRPDNVWYTQSHGLGYDTYGVEIFLGSGTASATSHWLGTWYRQDGVQFTVTKLSLRRVS